VADRKCATCDHPIRSSALRLCIRCQSELRRRLGNQAWAQEQLLVEYRKQAHKQARARAAVGHVEPIPFDNRASQLLLRQAKLLKRHAGTMQRIRREPPMLGPTCRACRHRSCRTIRAGVLLSSSVPAMALYLARNLELLKRNHFGQTLLEQLRPLDEQVLRIVDLPEMRTRFLAGPCPKIIDDVPCPGRVDACIPADERLGGWLECKTCGATWPSWEWTSAGQAILARETQLQLQAAIAEQLKRKAAV
jgi:hypothetical protein